MNVSSIGEGNVPLNGISKETISKQNIVNDEIEKDNKTIDYIVDISKDGQNRRNKAEALKKSGISAEHEAWEDYSIETKNNLRYDSDGNLDLIESMRIDEPETYSKYKDIREKFTASRPSYGAYMGNGQSFNPWGYWTDEQKSLAVQSALIEMDWFERRCKTDGNFSNPIGNAMNVVENIESLYSDLSHSSSINFYGPNNNDPDRDNMWRFNSKFNILLSTNMLKILENTNSDSLHYLIEKLDKSIKDMREIEKQYEGDYEWLKFGVKFYDDGNITYHAHYAGCDKNGITANSAEELLSILNRK